MNDFENILNDTQSPDPYLENPLYADYFSDSQRKEFAKSGFIKFSLNFTPRSFIIMKKLAERVNSHPKIKEIGMRQLYPSNVLRVLLYVAAGLRLTALDELIYRTVIEVGKSVVDKREFSK